MVFKSKKVVRKPRTRAEIIRAGNIARRGKIKSRDVARQRGIQRRREEAERKEKMERIKREYQAQVAKAAQAQQEAEAKRIREGRAFYFANRERMSFSQVAGQPFPVPVGGSQVIGGKFVTDPKTGKQVLESSFQKKQMEHKMELVQKQYESVKTQYGQAKADVGLEKMGYSIEKPKFVAPGTSDLQVKPGETISDALIRQGMSKEQAKTWLAQLEKDKSGVGYQVQKQTLPGGAERFKFDERDVKEKKISIVQKKIESEPGWKKSILYASTMWSPTGSGQDMATQPTGASTKVADVLGWDKPTIKSASRIAAESAVGTHRSYKDKSVLQLATSPKFVREVLEKSPAGNIAAMYGILAGGSLLLGSKVVVGAIGTGGVTNLGRLMMGGYAYERGSSMYSAYQSKDANLLTTLGLKTATDVAVFKVAGRHQIKESTMKELKALSYAQRMEALRMYKASDIIGTKTPPVSKVKISGQGMDKTTGSVINKWLLKNQFGIKAGGSQTVEAQLLAKYRKGFPKSDVDLYHSSYRNPVKDVQNIAKSLKAAGVKNVVVRGTSIKVGGSKVLEFHPAKTHLYRNIETVESIYKPTRSFLTKSPGGIKMLKLRTQMKRDVLRYYAQSKGYDPIKRAEYKYKMETAMKSQIEWWKTDVIPKSPPGLKQYRSYQLKKVENLLSNKPIKTYDIKNIFGSSSMKGMTLAGSTKTETSDKSTQLINDLSKTTISTTTKPPTTTKTSYDYPKSSKTIIPIGSTEYKTKSGKTYKYGYVKPKPYTIKPKPQIYKAPPYKPTPYKVPSFKIPTPPYKPTKTPPYTPPPYKTITPPPYTPPPYKTIRKTTTPPPRIRQRKRGRMKRPTPKRRLYTGKTKYKPSLIGVIKQKKIKEEPKKLTGYDIRGILIGGKPKKRLFK